MERLQKALASAGIASRRKSEELILAGRVAVNGVIVRELGVKVSGNDELAVDGKTINSACKKRVFLLNKPVGYLSTCKDTHGRKTILELLPSVAGLHPVGRLDKDTSGLLLVTNDGDLTYKITHPKYEIEKEYEAEINGCFTKNHVAVLLKGIVLDDGFVKPKAVKIVSSTETTSTVRLTIIDGRNREVRRIFDCFEFKVTSLKRIRLGNLTLDKIDSGNFVEIYEPKLFGKKSNQT